MVDGRAFRQNIGSKLSKDRRRRPDSAGESLVRTRERSSREEEEKEKEAMDPG
jgi:hypothetical protein